MNDKPWKERHFLATDPPFDMDALAAEAMAAWNACHALGVEPGELEAKVRQLVGIGRQVAAHLDTINDFPCRYCHADTYDGEEGIAHKSHCLLRGLRLALANWEGKP